MWALKSVQYFNQFIVPPLLVLRLQEAFGWISIIFTRYLGYTFFKLIAIIIIKRCRTLKPQLASPLTRKKKATIFTKLQTFALLHFTN